MASSNINEKVQQALEEGHPWEEIKAHLSTLDNPEAKSYLSGLKTASQTQIAPVASDVKTGLLDFVQANPQDALLYGAGAYAALQAPKIASKVADYRLKQRELGLKERSLAAYESQVSKQGAMPELLNPQDDLIKSVRQNEFDQLKATQPTQPTARELRDQIALQRDQLKLEQDKIKHENFVRQNTLTPEEQVLGRKFKDPADEIIAKRLLEQQNKAAPTFNQGPALTSAVPSPQPAYTTSAPQPAINMPPAGSVPPQMSQPVAPVIPPPASTPVAQVIATAPTSKAVEETIAKKEPVVKVKKPVDPTEVGLTKEQISMKRYLESNYGGGEVGAKTYAKVGEILGYTPAYEPGKGGGLKPEENALIKGYRKENIEGPKVNLDKNMKRALKGGAAAAALMAIPGFADAAQKKDYGRMVDLASDFIVPPFAGSTELGVSTLGEKQMKAFENAQKLGSPYRSVPPR